MTTFFKSVKNQLADDYRVAKRLPRFGWKGGLLIGVAVISILILMDHFHQGDRAALTIMTIGAFAAVLWFKRQLRNETWFRVTIAVLACIHIDLIRSVRWDYNRVPGRAVGGAWVLDTLLLVMLLAVIGKLWTGQTPLERERARLAQERKLARERRSPPIP